MSYDDDVAKARIAQELKYPTGSLDLSDLVLDMLPKELAGLTALQSLDCSSIQVSDLSMLASLTALQRLDCCRTLVSDLSPLSGLTGLQSLDCWLTWVSDLAPLSGLTALQSLNCAGTQVGDLSPLSALPALQSLNCGGTHVSDLSPLSALPALQSVDCSGIRVSRSVAAVRVARTPAPRLLGVPVERVAVVYPEQPSIDADCVRLPRLGAAPWHPVSIPV